MATALANDPLADDNGNGAVITAPTAPANAANLFVVEVDDTQAEINMEAVPEATRKDLLRSAVQNFVTNRVSTAKSVLKKRNEPFDLYDAAYKNDPLQNLVTKPDGEREQLDVVDVMSKAVTALYEGKFGRRIGDGRKSKPTRDPLVTQITRAVVQEVYQKGKAADPQYKYPMAAKLVGNDGLAYLRASIDRKVAAGGDAKALNDLLEFQYIRPAKVMLGQIEAAPRFKDVEGIL